VAASRQLDRFTPLERPRIRLGDDLEGFHCANIPV
jgi:hypothetical protein